MRLAITSAALLVSASAFAADLPARGPAIAPAPILVASGWNGFYLGANIGYGCCGEDTVRAIQIAPALAGFGPRYANMKPAGVFGGLQAGYNMQLSDFVLGIEVDAQLSGMRDSFSVNPIPGTLLASRGHSDIKWFATLRPRLGYLVTPNTLVYATGGAAVAGMNYSVAVSGTNFVPPTATMASNYTAIGWTAGAGLEHKFSPNWSLKAEYLYANFGKKTLIAPMLPANGQVFRTYATPDAHIFRVGVNYHFATGGGAVVAKY